MGSASLAEAIKGTIQEAQQIIDDFYTTYPKVKKWIDETDLGAKKNYYVEDFYGRRRRLNDLSLPKVQVSFAGQSQVQTEFNPFIGSKNIISSGKKDILEQYKAQLEKCNTRQQFSSMRKKAEENGLVVQENSGKISRAERQCVNARIQGGAATMSKIAMRKVYDSKELRELGFSILLQIHDELIGECPEENADKVASILTDIMKNSVSDIVQVPFKCDPDISPCWYFNDHTDAIKEDLSKLISSGKDYDDAISEIVAQHSEFEPEVLINILNNK